SGCRLMLAFMTCTMSVRSPISWACCSTPFWMPASARRTRGDSEPTRLSRTWAQPCMPFRGERRSCAAVATRTLRALMARSRWVRSTASSKPPGPPSDDASGTCGTGFFLFVVDVVAGTRLVRGAVFLEAVVEGLQADAEYLGCTLFHAAALLQRRHDELAVGLGKRGSHCHRDHRIGGRTCGRNLQWHGKGPNHRVIGHDEDTLHIVLEFAHVTRPGVRIELGEHFGRQHLAGL